MASDVAADYFTKEDIARSGAEFWGMMQEREEREIELFLARQSGGDQRAEQFVDGGIRLQTGGETPLITKITVSRNVSDWRVCLRIQETIDGRAFYNRSITFSPAMAMSLSSRLEAAANELLAATVTHGSGKVAA